LLARLFAVPGVLLVPWSGVLIEQLHGQANKRSFKLLLAGTRRPQGRLLPVQAQICSRVRGWWTSSYCPSTYPIAG
jgi:hypothetical protein